ncbi:MAG: hypothetical protein RL757_661 [Bacteroidota bacterium]|jgi:CBS domain containing-hemolysin-like protein
MIWILISLLLTAFFSGAEIAYVSANKLLVELRRKRMDNGASRILSRFYDQPARFLGTMLVGHNIALVMFTILMTDLLTPYAEPYIADEFSRSLVLTVIITFVVLILAEYLPKSIFKTYADRVLFWFAYPLRFFQILLAIPTNLLTFTSTFLLKTFFNAPPSVSAETVFTRGDLEYLINSSFVTDSSQNDSQNHAIDTQLFNNVLQLKDIRIKKCMIPRAEIVHFEVSESVETLRELFVTTKISRILVTDGNLDEVLGYIHHQQMMHRLADVKSQIRAIDFVPEVMQADDLMEQFVAQRTNIAVVVDEFGSVSGLITLEDVLEQIFGEIEDEYDREEFVEQQIGEREWLFSGRMETKYLNETYHLELPISENYHTLSGLLVKEMGNIPPQGEKMDIGNYTFIAELVTETRIETIRIFYSPKLSDN